MPKLLFIQPTQYGIDGKLCKQKTIYLPGLVFPLLAAMTPDNWEVEIAIEVVDEVNFESDADLIGIGTMGYTIYRGLEIAKEFKKRGKTVVMGGYMASLVSEQLLDQIDSVVIGDAEIAYPQLLKDFESKGIQKKYHSPVKSLHNLPLPRYDLLTAKPIGNMLPIQAGRGCDKVCSFCSISSLYHGNYMTRPVDEVMRDIHAVKDLGFKQFYLLDDNIVSNPDYLRELCKEIEPLNMTWASQCTLHLAKDIQLMETVQRSGGNMMSFGIESITQEGLNKLGKAWLNVKEHEQLIDTLSKSGILVSSEMMLGTDSDTEETILNTLSFIKRTRIPIPRFYILTPIPGTNLFNKFKQEGRLKTEDLEKFDGSSCVHIPESISPEKLTNMFWWIYNKVFTFRNILRRTLFHPQARKSPARYFFAFIVNLHYRKYIRKKVPPNIF